MRTEVGSKRPHLGSMILWGVFLTLYPGPYLECILLSLSRTKRMLHIQITTNEFRNDELDPQFQDINSHSLQDFFVLTSWRNSVTEPKVLLLFAKSLSQMTVRGERGAMYKGGQSQKSKTFLSSFSPLFPHCEPPLETCLITHRGDISTGHGEEEQTDKKKEVRQGIFTSE